MSYPKTEAYLSRLEKEGKAHPLLINAVRGQFPEVKFVEYFIEKLCDKPGSHQKIAEAIEKIPQDEYINMASHHWRSFMSELTAYWILETQLGYSIEQFDIQSPYRIDKGSNCDAFCRNQGQNIYIEIKAAHDSTRFVPPEAIKELLKDDHDFRYQISINKFKYKVTKDFLNHVKKEIEIGKAYLRSVELDASYDINSPDSRNPHDITITIFKKLEKETHFTTWTFPPKENEQFSEWLSYRILEANNKGANLLMVNYIFWEDVDHIMDFRTLLKRNTPGLENDEAYWRLGFKERGIVDEVIVFMPSGTHERIHLVTN